MINSSSYIRVGMYIIIIIDLTLDHNVTDNAHTQSLLFNSILYIFFLIFYIFIAYINNNICETLLYTNTHTRKFNAFYIHCVYYIVCLTKKMGFYFNILIFC